MRHKTHISYLINSSKNPTSHDTIDLYLLSPITHGNKEKEKGLPQSWCGIDNEWFANPSRCHPGLIQRGGGARRTFHARVEPLLPRDIYYPSDDIWGSNGRADPRVVETTSVIMIPVGRAERRRWGLNLTHGLSNRPKWWNPTWRGKSPPCRGHMVTGKVTQPGVKV